MKPEVHDLIAGVTCDDAVSHMRRYPKSPFGSNMRQSDMFLLSREFTFINHGIELCATLLANFSYSLLLLPLFYKINGGRSFRCCTASAAAGGEQVAALL